MNDGLETVLINGGRDGTISPRDRGLHFGDGVFETIACRAGRPRFIDLHLERLASGCERLHIPLGSLETLRDEVRMLAREAEASIIKLIVTRGEADARGYRVSGRERSSRIMLRYSWPEEDPANARDGVVTAVCSLRLGENPALAGPKHLNRLEQILAQADYWPDREAAEALLFSSSGRLVSGTMSNVFVVRDGNTRTPHIDLCGVAGIMRRVVLREAKRAGVAIEECVLRSDDLDRAEEIFLTNARIGIWPVRRLGNRVLAPGSVTRQLQRLIAPMLEDPVDA